MGDGAADTHYSIQETGTQGVVINQANIPGVWLANDAVSRWIWETATGQPTSVTRTFDLQFDLTGFDHTTASIAGRWSTDNRGLDILLNGVSTGQTAGGFGSWYNFSLNSGFQAGINKVSFVVYDFGAISGFRAEFTNSSVTPTDPTNPVPVPASLPLLAGALALTAFLRRRR